MYICAYGDVTSIIEKVGVQGSSGPPRVHVYNKFDCTCEWLLGDNNSGGGFRIYIDMYNKAFTQCSMCMRRWVVCTRLGR